MGEMEAAWSQHRIDTIAALLTTRAPGMSADAIRKLARDLNELHERRHLDESRRLWSMGLLPREAIGRTDGRDLKDDCALIAEMLPLTALSEDQEGEGK